MEAASSARERWVLTKDVFERFLKTLDPDPVQAGILYEQIRAKLATFFRCNGCCEGDDLVDETLDRAMRRSNEIEIQNLPSFIRGVARNVASEAHKRKKRISSIEEIPEPVWDRSPQGEERAMAQHASPPTLNCLEGCIRTLTAEENRIIAEYYQYEKREKIVHKQTLAAELGISATTLRVKAFRARKRLEKCVLECAQRSDETKRELNH